MLTVLLVGAGLLFVSACGDGGASGGNLVIYTSLNQDFVGPILERFEEETGINVEVVMAGTGELTARIRAEAGNPQSDIMWSGGMPTIAPNADLFATYSTVNEPYFYDSFRNVEGNLTRFTFVCYVLIVNTEFIGDIPVRGYADLLNPELRGRIAITDPATSSSAFSHLVNKLYAMGNGNPDSDEAWEFVEAFVDNLDGIMLGSSSAVIRGVAEGEYWVGLTFEEGPMPFVAAGAPMELVHMTEGVLFSPDGVNIVIDAPNMENAQTFVDFVTGYEIQTLIQENLFRRSIRTDVVSEAGGLRAMTDINAIEADLDRILTSRDVWLDRFREIWER